jgi:Outer membrane protein beta-barrel domain
MKFSVLKVGVIIALSLFFSEAFAQTLERRIEVGGVIPIIDLNDSVGEKTIGIGGRFTYNFTDNFAFDSEASYFPENPSGNFGQTVALAGLRAGIRSEIFGAFAKVRPGVAHFGGDSFRARNNGSQSYFAVDLGAALEYYPSPRVILRFDIGDTIIPFGNNAINTGGLPNTIRPGTTHNLLASFGVGFRF